MIEKIQRLLSHKIVAGLLVFGTFWGVINHSKHYERWLWPHEEYISETKPLHEDDAGYVAIAEIFWGIPHDPSLSNVFEPWRKTLPYYPFRGIGQGTIILVLHHYFPQNWRLQYLRFLAVLEAIGILSFAAGLAYWFRSIWIFPLTAYLFVQYSWWLDVRSFRITEGVVRGALPLLLGLMFFFAGLYWHRNKSNALKGIIGLSYFLVAAFICLLKSQWLAGIVFTGPLLFLSSRLRRPGLFFLASSAGVYFLLLGINYFGFHGNTDIFTGAAWHAARNIRGLELKKLGCARGDFPPEARGVICNQQEDEILFHWGVMAEKLDSPALYVEVSNVLKKLNFEYIISNPSDSFFLAWNGIWQMNAFVYLNQGWDTPFAWALYFIFLVVFLLLMPWENILLILSVVMICFVSVWLPSSLTGGWDGRYILPVRTYFHTFPLIWGFVLLLHARELWQKIVLLKTKDPKIDFWRKIHSLRLSKKE